MSAALFQSGLARLEEGMSGDSWDYVLCERSICLDEHIYLASTWAEEWQCK
jgi:hypothetical protein